MRCRHGREEAEVRQKSLATELRGPPAGDLGDDKERQGPGADNACVEQVGAEPDKEQEGGREDQGTIQGEEEHNDQGEIRRRQEQEWNLAEEQGARNSQQEDDDEACLCENGFTIH